MRLVSQGGLSSVAQNAMAMHLLNQQLTGTSSSQPSLATHSLPASAVPVTALPQHESPIASTSRVQNVIPQQSPPSSGGSTNFTAPETLRETPTKVVDNGEGDEDCVVTDGQASRRPWQPEEFLFLMELIHDDYIREALEGGKARKKDFLIYAKKVSMHFNIVCTAAQVRDKYTNTRTHFTNWKDTWKLSGGGVDPARQWITMSDAAWKEHCIIDPKKLRDRRYFGTLENGKRILEICEVIYGTQGV